jgi:hypothetical protein
MMALSLEQKTIEVLGNLWNYNRIATISYLIAEDFLDRVDIPPGLDKSELLGNFSKRILDTSNGINRDIYLIGTESLFDVRYEENNYNSPGPYSFNGDKIVDFEGNPVSDNFEYNSLIDFNFIQGAKNDKFIKRTDIPRQHTETFQDFVSEVCERYEGILSIIYPEGLQKVTEYQIMAGIKFDEKVHKLGTGPQKVNLYLYP